MGARAAFSKSLDVLFRSMGRRALYKSLDATEEREILSVYRMPDTTLDVQDSFISSSSNILELQVSEIAFPKAGDQIILEERTFVVQGEPQRDQHNLIWKVNIVERT